jgi:hypothetical protein
MPPGLVQPAQIDPDTYYMLWEQSPSGGWVQERAYRGQYVLDALADELRQKATTSRPMIVMPMGDVPEPVRAAAPAAPAAPAGDAYVARGWPMGWDGSSNHARRLLIARVERPSDLNESRLETAMESETPETRQAIVDYLDEIARQGVVTNEIVNLAEQIKADLDAEDAEYEVPAAPAAAPSFSVGDKVMVRSLYPDIEPDFAGNFRGVMGGQGVVVVETTGAQMAVPLDRLYKPAGPPPGSLTARAEALAAKIEALYADAEAATRFPALRVGVTGKVIDAETLRKRIPVLSKADLEDFEEDYQNGVKALAELRAREAERALPRMTLPVPDKPAEREMTPLQKQIANMLGYKRNPRRLRRNPALSDRGRAAITRILTEQKGANAREADRVLTELDAVATALDAEPQEFVRRVLAALDAVLSTVRQAEQDEIDRLLEEAAGGAAPAPVASTPAPAPEPEPTVDQRLLAVRLADELKRRGWDAVAQSDDIRQPAYVAVKVYGFDGHSATNAVMINREGPDAFVIDVNGGSMTRYIMDVSALEGPVLDFAGFIAATYADDNLFKTSEEAREAELESMLAAPAPAPMPAPAPAPTGAVPPYDIEDRTRKSGAPYVVLIPEGRVSKEEWKRRIASAKRAGSQRGWSSAWGGKRGGYPFDTREEAISWWHDYHGATTTPPAPAPTPAPAPETPRYGEPQVSEAVAARLRGMGWKVERNDERAGVRVWWHGFDGTTSVSDQLIQRNAPGHSAFHVVTDDGQILSAEVSNDYALATAADLFAGLIDARLRLRDRYPTSEEAREAELESMLGGGAAPAAAAPAPTPAPAPAGPSASTLVTEAVRGAVEAAQGTGRRVVPTGATSTPPADDKAAALAALFADV